MNIQEQIKFENRLNKIIGYKSEKLQEEIHKISKDYNLEESNVLSYIKQFRIIEDVPTTGVSGMAVVDRPLMDKPLTRKKHDEDFSSTDVIFDVDHDMYHKCIEGKKKFTRWGKFIDETSELGAGIRHAAKTKNVVLRNQSTGAMIKLTDWKK